MPLDYGTLPTIAIQDQSTTPWGYDLAATVAALQKHLDNDFYPAWGRRAQLALVQTGQPMPPGAWHLLIVDSASEPGAEGYHDLTDDGFPQMFVGVKDTLGAGDKVPTTICHEIDEGIIDPAINLMAEAPDGVEWAIEVCDAVETDEYSIDGIPMSDFQLPAYFEGNLKPGEARFDFLNLVSQPFQILKGGYMSIKRHGHWTQVFGSREAKVHHSKRARRRASLREAGGRHKHHVGREAARVRHINLTADYVY